MESKSDDDGGFLLVLLCDFTVAPDLKFLVAIFVAVTLTWGVLSGIGSHHCPGLSGTYQCLFVRGNDVIKT